MAEMLTPLEWAAPDSAPAADFSRSKDKIGQEAFAWPVPPFPSYPAAVAADRSPALRDRWPERQAHPRAPHLLRAR